MCYLYAEESKLMKHQSNFWKFSVIGMVAILLVLAALGSASVRASVALQATDAVASMVSATEAATASGTTSATTLATEVPTLGGDEAYPPCPVLATATPAASPSVTAAATSEQTQTATVTSDAANTPEAMSEIATSQSLDSTAPVLMATTTHTGHDHTSDQPVITASAAGTANATDANATPIVQIGAFKEVDGCKLSVTLSGTVGGSQQGDPDGTGTAILTLTRPESGTGEVCFQLEVGNIALPAHGSHIHAGPVSIEGPAVIPLGAPDASGKASGCVSGINRSLIKTLLLYPSLYYINVHNDEFPNGTIRGQLQIAD
jgi:hypothetical protein